MKEIIEGQLKQASEQMNQSEEFESTEVITHLEESLQTGEEDIVFAQNKLKTRTSSLCKEGLAFEVRILIPKNTINIIYTIICTGNNFYYFLFDSFFSIL